MPRRSPTRGKSHLRAISKHKKSRKIKRREEIRSRRWRHPKTGAMDKWATMRARKRAQSVRISKWLQNLDKTMSRRRKFTIGKKVDDLSTLLGKMSVKKSRSTAKNLSKLFKTMSVKKSKRSRRKKY